MTNYSTNQKDEPVTAAVIIPDECGDSLWDAVLEQHLGIDTTQAGSGTANSLLKAFHTTGNTASVKINQK